MDQVALWSIIGAHAAVDMQTMSLTTMLPDLLDKFGLNYATAAAIITANQLVIALTQPLFGIMGDRKPVRWLVILGCALTGLMMAAITWLPNYWMVIGAVILSGLGSAIFHPEGLSSARVISGNRRNTGTSWFFFGGNLGFGAAPFLVALLVERFGIHGPAGLLVFTLIGCCLLLWQMHKFNRVSSSVRAADATLAAASRKSVVIGMIVFLLALIMLRSTVMEGMKIFIPIHFTELGWEKKTFAPLLAAISLSGIIGTLISGPMADKVGRRAVMVAATLGSFVALFAFWRVEDYALRMLCLAAFGCFSTMPWTVTVTMIQDLLPNNPGLAGGLTLGTAYGASGIGASLLGALADQIGVSATLGALAFVPLFVAALSLAVPAKNDMDARVAALSG